MANPQTAPDYRRVLIHSIVSFLGQSLMQIVDLLFCGDLGPNATATVGSSTTFFAWFMILGIGISSSLEYLIPHSLGSKEPRKAREYFQAGVALIAILSIAAAVLMHLLTRLGPLYGMNPEIVDPVQSFSRILSLSFFPTFLIPLLRIELQANGRPHDSSLGYLYGNLLNIFLNWALVYGHAGFPALGLNGSAYANFLSRMGILAFLLYRLVRARRVQPFEIPAPPVKWKLRIKTILRMGIPSSLHMLFEVGAFIFVSTLASRLSAEENSAHAIALSVASFLFMIPAGMASAAALTMSRALGEKKPDQCVALGDRTLRLGVFYALCGSLALFLLQSLIVGLFTRNQNTIEIGSALLLITAAFQFGDALQAILSGCIRGFGETKVQAKMNGLGHWLIGIPAGLLLAYPCGYGIRGLWMGLSAGLFSVAGLLGWKYWTLRARILGPQA